MIRIFRSKATAPLLLVGITLAIYFPTLAYLSRHATDLEVPWQGIVDIKPGFPVTWGDSIEYYLLAENLIQYKSFSFSAYPGGPSTPESLLTPGYPFFAALIKTVFGSYLAVSVFQILLVALTGVLIYRIGRTFLSPNLSFVAALFYILDPSTLHHAMLLLTDIPFVFLLVLLIYVLFFRQHHAPATAFLAGILLGAAVLTRPIGTYLGIPLILFYAFMYWRALGVKRMAVHILLFLTGCSLLLTPWLARNKILFGTSRISAPSFQLLAWNMRLFLANKQHRDPGEVWQAMRQEHGFLADEEHMGNMRHLEVKRQFSLRYDAAMTKIALGYIKQDPFGYAKFHLLKTLPIIFGSSLRSSFVYDHFLQGTGGPDLYPLLISGNFGSFIRGLVTGKNWIFSLERLGWLTIVIFGLTPLMFLRDDKNRYIPLFCCLAAYFIILASPSDYVRYRLPAEPWMFLAAMAGLANIRPLLQKIGFVTKTSP